MSGRNICVPPLKASGCAKIKKALVADVDDSERQLIIDQLMIHYSNSFPTSNDPSDGTPRMKLQCTRSVEQLQKLTMQYIESIQAYIERQSNDGENSLAKVCQAEIWELVNVLFSLVPAEEDPIADDASDASDQGNLISLASMERRAKFSSWLKNNTHDSMRNQLEEIKRHSGNINEEILSLLSGHDLSGAVMSASASGNVRLATLLATAGSSSEAVSCIVDQQRIWDEEGYAGHIDEQLLQVYDILSGNVDSAMYIVGNDWKRSVGMHLWYGTPKTSPVSAAVSNYLNAVQEGLAPFPGPWHPLKATPDAKRPTDTAFELIRMFCFSEEWDSHEEKSAAALGALPDLLCPLGVSPDVHRVDFYWHLLGVLEAIGVIPDADLTPKVEDAIARVISSFIFQLESIGGLTHWAIYVALHIRNVDHRDFVVKDLLSRYVEDWHSNEEAVEFLVEKLGIPVSMMEEAKASWALFNNDCEMELESLMDAQEWNRAHELFRRKIAPTWFLAQDLEGSQGILHGPLLGALEEFELHESDLDPDEWRIGGHLYLSYFRLKEKLLHIELLDDNDIVAIHEMAQAVDDAYAGASQGPGDASLEKAAYAALAGELSDMRKPGSYPEELNDLAKSGMISCSGTRPLRCSQVQRKIMSIAQTLLCE